MRNGEKKGVKDGMGVEVDFKDVCRVLYSIIDYNYVHCRIVQ